MSGVVERGFDTYRLRKLYTARLWGGLRTFWRHDVDYSLDAAWAMAQFEGELGVQSTYFLMPGNPFYSEGDALALAMLLSGRGHKIGWHVDTRHESIDDIASSVQSNVAVSFHCPREHELWLPYNFNCAYREQWQGRYYSDSRGEFAYGDPEDSTDHLLQISLHPEWWFLPDWADEVSDEDYEAFWYEPKSLLPAR